MNVAQLITTDYRRALIGIGVTGRSVARYLTAQQKEFDVFDTRKIPAGIDAFREEFPGAKITLGAISESDLSGYREIILSPGIDPNQSWLKAAKADGAELIGDIELFARQAQAPIVAITGSNAKSTVTTLFGEMAKAAGLNVGIGGNLGTAALDLLSPERDIYVLELSSFQLELVKKLNAKAACILNMSPDHMDRYPSMITYHAAKQRIYMGAEKLVYNHEDQLTQPLLQEGQSAISFGRGKPDLHQYGIDMVDGEQCLVKGHDKILAASELKLRGLHNLSNILACFALGESLGLSQSVMKQAAMEFGGLSHRCELVGEQNAVVWINDSKATNVGAAKAAIEGFASPVAGEKTILLILGGQAKGQSFSELRPLISKYVKQLILIGEDADQIVADISDAAPAVYAVDMKSAVKTAEQLAGAGDTVLLSPACASFDMFAGFEDRGRQFAQAIADLDADIVLEETGGAR